MTRRRMHKSGAGVLCHVAGRKQWHTKPVSLIKLPERMLAFNAQELTGRHFADWLVGQYARLPHHLQSKLLRED